MNDVGVSREGAAATGLPKVPKVPTSSGFPSRSATTTATGPFVDYVPLHLIATSSITGAHIGIPPGPGPIRGLVMNPSVVSQDGSVNASAGDLIGTLELDMNSPPAAGSVLQIQWVWERLFQALVPADEPPPTKQQSVTHGVAKEQTTTFTTTVGAQAGMSFEALSAELSASFSSSTSQGITITEETTESETFNWAQTSVPQWVAAYQLRETFSVLPTAALTDFIAQMKHDHGSDTTTVALPQAYPYPSDTYATTAGPAPAD